MWGGKILSCDVGETVFIVLYYASSSPVGTLAVILFIITVNCINDTVVEVEEVSQSLEQRLSSRDSVLHKQGLDPFTGLTAFPD